jgi:hypothetical protein
MRLRLSRVSKLALKLTAPVVSEFACLKALPALPFDKTHKNVYISAVSANFKESIAKHARLKTEEHAGGMPRHARHESSAGLAGYRSVDVPARSSCPVGAFTRGQSSRLLVRRKAVLDLCYNGTSCSASQAPSSMHF